MLGGRIGAPGVGKSWLCAAGVAAALLAVSASSGPAQGQAEAGVKRTYVSLTEYGFKAEHDRDANAVLLEPVHPGPNARIVGINTHPKNRNNFEYFVGKIMSERGYRMIQVNDYGPETAEDLVLPIAAAVRYARSLPNVKAVVLIGQSGGGPVLSYYQELAENGPTACQGPTRILPCKGEGLNNLPKADALLVLEANIGAPHMTMSLDPAIDTRAPKVRDPALDMYNPQNGYDPKTNKASYSPEFIKKYTAAMHTRNEKVIAEAQAALKAAENKTGPFDDDLPFLVAGMSESSGGTRLYLADNKVLAHTHGKHPVLKADGSTKVEIAPMIAKTAGLRAERRNSLDGTAQSMTVRQFLSMSAVRTTPDFALTEDRIVGVDWRSSGYSPVGAVQKVSVPTLVMAGNCMIHLLPAEAIFDNSVAKDKEFVIVDGADHDFEPCRPEFGDTEKRTWDYVESWLNKRF